MSRSPVKLLLRPDLGTTPVARIVARPPTVPWPSHPRPRRRRLP